MGERLLRQLQLKAAGRVPEWRDLLLVEASAGAGRTLAGSLQHHPATLFARLQIASTGDVATRSENRMEKWKAKYPFHFPTPSTATRYLQNSLRYTKTPTGTKDRALQRLPFREVAIEPHSCMQVF
jgi:hypothetical protein